MTDPFLHIRICSFQICNGHSKYAMSSQGSPMPLYGNDMVVNGLVSYSSASHFNLILKCKGRWYPGIVTWYCWYGTDGACLDMELLSVNQLFSGIMNWSLLVSGVESQSYGSMIGCDRAGLCSTLMGYSYMQCLFGTFQTQVIASWWWWPVAVISCVAR